MIYQEISTDEVEEYTKNDSRLFVRIPISTGDFSFNKVLGFVKTLEESVSDKNDLGIIVFSSNGLLHYSVEKSSMSQYKITEKILNSLHLDYLPYTDVIVSLPKTEENQKLLKEISIKFGII